VLGSSCSTATSTVSWGGSPPRASLAFCSFRAAGPWKQQLHPAEEGAPTKAVAAAILGLGTMPYRDRKVIAVEMNTSPGTDAWVFP
jgi:hypothetical protein